MTLVFMLEERSMEVTLDALLPGLLPPSTEAILIPHEGKRDLDKSLPRKLRAWRKPGASFVVLRDCDSADCHDVKEKLSALCADAGRPDSVIRIVCPHLEAWFLGDLQAVSAAYERPAILRQKGKAKFRNPDALANASDELKKLVPNYQKLAGARAIAERMNVQANTSVSFGVFVEGLRRLG